jgi:rSAM/selenodomain-associated transferase 2
VPSAVTLSIVIPTWNEAAVITRAVERAWELGPGQVVVADGGSSDGTQALAAARGAEVVEAPRGRARQQNAGARQAHGRWLLFLHADTWLEAAAAAQVQAAMADPACQAAAFRQRIEAEGALYRWIERGNALRARMLGLAYGDQGLLVRRALFDEVGGFADLPLMEDVELAGRLRRRTRLRMLPGPLHTSARRWQQQGALRQTARNWMLLAAYFAGAAPKRLARWYPAHAAAPGDSEGPSG